MISPQCTSDGDPNDSRVDQPLLKHLDLRLAPVEQRESEVGLSKRGGVDVGKSEVPTGAC